MPARLGLRMGATSLSLVLATLSVPAQVRLADESDRAAFRAWFTLLADAQFEQPAREFAT